LFFYTSDLDDALIARKKDFSDNVTPSSNSSLAAGILKLSLFFSDADYAVTANNLMSSIKQSVLENPAFHAKWLNTAILLNYPLYEVGIVGEDNVRKRNMLAGRYLPNTILFGAVKKGSLPLLTDRYVERKTLIYVCEKGTCQLPVEQPDEALELITK